MKIDNEIGDNRETIKGGEFVFMKVCTELVNVLWREEVERVWMRFFGGGGCTRIRVTSINES